MVLWLEEGGAGYFKIGSGIQRFAPQGWELHFKNGSDSKNGENGIDSRDGSLEIEERM